MTESDLLAAIQLALSHGDTRLFRINAGVAWQGQVIHHDRDQLVLAHPRALRLAPAGLADLIGWHRGRFVALEGKIGRRQPTPEQVAFLDLVRRAGGLAGVVRSVEEAEAALR